MGDGSKVFVGLDVHKDSISVGVAQSGQQSARFVGKILHDVPKLLKQLEQVASPGSMAIVYEAGPTGYRSDDATDATIGRILEPVRTASMT